MPRRQEPQQPARGNAALPLPADVQPFDYARFQLVGASQAFLECMRTLERLTACDANILVQGETGTGKELAARAVHYLGRRRDAPFVPVNCGAIPEALIESELFGHTRGAFTDAREPHDGLVAQAQGGTLFLDEIEACSGRAQIALLRFLQEREYRPIGGRLVRGADVRIISASNVDLPAMVGSGRFRADLLFRLDVLAVRLPPLRDRGRDAVLLANTFAARYCRSYGRPAMALAAGLDEWLVAQPWPGNIRELENLVHRAVVLAEGPTLELRPRAQRDGTPERTRDALTDCSFQAAKARAIANFEREYIAELLARAHGNLSLAARVSGKERSRLGRLLKKHGLTRDAFVPHGSDSPPA